MRPRCRMRTPPRTRHRGHRPDPAARDRARSRQHHPHRDRARRTDRTEQSGAITAFHTCRVRRTASRGGKRVPHRGEIGGRTGFRNARGYRRRRAARRSSCAGDLFVQGVRVLGSLSGDNPQSGCVIGDRRCSSVSSCGVGAGGTQLRGQGIECRPGNLFSTAARDGRRGGRGQGGGANESEQSASVQCEGNDRRGHPDIVPDTAATSCRARMSRGPSLVKSVLRWAVGCRLTNRSSAVVRRAATTTHEEFATCLSRPRKGSSN